MSVISIQSQVVHGHVGNSAAVFPLQAHGIEVAAVPTTLLSNHPHYATMRGGVLNAALVQDLLLGVEERGLIDSCKLIMTGYLGSAEIAAAVIAFIGRAKARNPKLLYLCDPVMGDTDTGFYVEDGLPALMCEGLVPLADIITPNPFELEQLAGRASATAGEIVAAARSLGLSTVAVTGTQLADRPAHEVQTLAVEPRAAWMVSTPRLACRPSGTGDLFTAAFAAALLEGLSTRLALGRAVSGIYAVLEETAARRSYEMTVIAALPRMLRPGHFFEAFPLPPAGLAAGGPKPGATSA